MPHDMKGNKLKVGDKVNVPCVVKEVSGTQVTVVTVRLGPSFSEGARLIFDDCQVKKSLAKD